MGVQCPRLRKVAPLMNRRLHTPAIAVASFATAFVFASWHAGLWRRAPVTAPVVASLATPMAARQPAATVVTVPAAAPLPRQPDAPILQDESPDPPTARPADTAEFLAAQDRAASHSSRSR